MIAKDGTPIVAEKALSKILVPMLLHGGGTAEARGRVAGGLITAKVCEAYGVTLEDLYAEAQTR